MPQVKVFGIPYEGRENFQRGVSLAPSYIRYHLSSLEYYSVIQNKELEPFEDLSDIYPPWDTKGKDFADFLVKKLVELKITPLFIALGGDHFITYPIVWYLRNELKLNFTVVHFDAHMDRRAVFEREEYNHATFMYHVEKLMREDHVITVGVRTKAPCETKKKNIFYAWEDYTTVLKDIEGPVYLTFDLDVINPQDFPGVTNPEPGGKDIFTIINEVLSIKHIIGVDIVEFSPLLDPSTNSATKAAFVLRELLIKLQHGA